MGRARIYEKIRFSWSKIYYFSRDKFKLFRIILATNEL